MPADANLLLTALVTMLALLLYLYMGVTVSALRDKHGVRPPAISGAPEFERAFRVHQNTLEAMPLFVLPLWLAALWFQPARWLPAVIALAWIAGRFLYMRDYISADRARGPGLRIQAVAMVVNLVLAVAGIVIAKAA